MALMLCVLARQVVSGYDVRVCIVVTAVDALEGGEFCSSDQGCLNTHVTVARKPPIFE